MFYYCRICGCQAQLVINGNSLPTYYCNGCCASRLNTEIIINDTQVQRLNLTETITPLVNIHSFSSSETSNLDDEEENDEDEIPRDEDGNEITHDLTCDNCPNPATRFESDGTEWGSISYCGDYDSEDSDFSGDTRYYCDRCWGNR